MPGTDNKQLERMRPIGQGLRAVPWSSMKRILLIDDQPQMLCLMKASLDRNGYEVDTALSGVVAMKLLNETRYDVVVINAGLSSMPAEVLCQKLCLATLSDEALILVVGDAVQDGDLGWTHELPNVEHVEKPLSLRWMVARVTEYFGAFQAGQPFQ